MGRRSIQILVVWWAKGPYKNWDLLSSLIPIKPTEGKPKWLSKEERAQFTLSRELKDILIGLCLGDLHIQKEYANARLMFVQGALNKEYLDLLYQLFSSYCSMVPKTGSGAPDKRTGVNIVLSDLSVSPVPAIKAGYWSQYQPLRLATGRSTSH